MEENFDYNKAYNEAPQEVKGILDTLSPDDEGSYEAMSRVNGELNKIGWELDYYVSGDITYLGPLREE